MRKSDLLTSVVLMIGGLVLIAFVIPTFTAPAQSPLDVPPSRFPLISVSIWFVMAVMLFVSAFRRSPDESPASGPAISESALGLGKTELINIVIMAAVIAAIVFAMPVIGFEITMMVMLAAIMLYIGFRRYGLIVAVSLIVPLALSQLVWHVFSVELP